MRRRIMLLFGLGALLAPAAASGSVGAHSSEYGGVSVLNPAVVTVFTPTGRRVGDLCTGSLIHPRIVLTAAHCFPAGTVRTRVDSPLGGPEWGSVTIDPAYIRPAIEEVATNDLAIVRLRRRLRHTGALRLGVAQAGAPALSIGFGMPHPWQEAASVFTVTPGAPGGYLLCATDAATSLGGGDSGGPLLQDGMIVGVNEGSGGPGSGTQVFTPPDQWAWDQ